ncbi:MAG: hypothetical protein ACNA75_09020, partial [Thiohalomonadaceae bacterium]
LIEVVLGPGMGIERISPQRRRGRRENKAVIHALLHTIQDSYALFTLRTLRLCGEMFFTSK